MRALARLATMRHAIDEAREWAERTLKEAGLPSSVGRYAPGPDGKSLLPAPSEMIGRETDFGDITVRIKPDEPVDTPWVLMLPRAVKRLGYAIETPEWQAAQLLYELARVEQWARQGNARKVQTEAFYAGMRWQRRQMDKSDEGRRAVLAGAKKAAAANVKHDPADKMRWVLADRLLQREGVIQGVLVKAGGIASAHERSELLGQYFRVKPGTLRKEVREIRRRTDPKK